MQLLYCFKAKAPDDLTNFQSWETLYKEIQECVPTHLNNYFDGTQPKCNCLHVLCHTPTV